MKKNTLKTISVTEEVGNIFSKNIDEKSAKYMREILNTNNRRKEDIKNVFYILCFILQNPGEIDLENGWFETLKNLHGFFKNDEIASKDCFSQILNDIVEEIKRILDETNIEKQKVEADVLVEKINTIFVLGDKKSKLEDEELYGLLSRVLNLDNLDEKKIWKNLFFITQLFNIPELNEYPDKMNIIINLLLTKQINFVSSFEDDQDYRSLVMKLLANPNFLALSNEYYEKAMELILEKRKGFVVSLPINNPSIPMTKKEIIIDYYKDIFNKHVWNRRLSGEKESKECQFSVILSEKLLAMDDEDYRKVLNDIATCNKPHSYAMVINDINLSDSKRKIACHIIKSGEVKKQHDLLTEEDGNKDYKFYVAKAAISPVLKLVGDEEYEMILVLINSYCERAEIAYHQHSKESIDRFSVNINKARAITALLSEKTSYEENIPRLLFTINEIEILPLSENEYVMNLILEFLTHPYSVYYTEEECKRIIEMIRDPKNREKHYEITSLFINSNVPYMEDKSILFETASNSSKEEIVKLKKKFENEGIKNKNIHNIFSNMNDETIYALSERKISIGEAPTGRGSK